MAKPAPAPAPAPAEPSKPKVRPVQASVNVSTTATTPAKKKKSSSSSSSSSSSNKKKGGISVNININKGRKSSSSSSSSSKKKKVSDKSVEVKVKIPDNCCHECGKPIVGGYLNVNGIKFHKDCFVCSKCKNPIKDYFIKDNHYLCRNCYMASVTPNHVCAKCKKGIYNEIISAAGKEWHPECFVCGHCGKTITAEYTTKDDVPYCSVACMSMASGRVCAGCKQIITSAYVTVLGKLYHKECFVCTACRTPFPTMSFFNVGGQPYCEVCSARAQGGNFN